MGNPPSQLISSKEVLARTGISRATLNNYISLDLIPTPTIGRPEEPGGPTKIGYFPGWVVGRIEKIQEMKATGMRISDIAAFFREERKEEEFEEKAPSPAEVVEEFGYRSLAQIVFPALLVNEHWEIIWINRSAEQVLFKEPVHEIASAQKRNLFRLLLVSALAGRFVNWQEVFSAHLRLAKRDLSQEALEHICRQVEDCPSEQVAQLYHQAEPLSERPISQQKVLLQPPRDKRAAYILFSSEFREGTLLFYTPASMQLDHIVHLLMGRERLIKAVLSRRIPSLTPLGIVCAKLHSDLHLRTALPPHEYFDLINQMVLTSHRCFKEHGGTPGRSFQETVVCFFLSAPESPQHYLLQALHCAQDLQQMISSLDKRWKYRKSWNNTLGLNIGIHCGHEWLGTIPSSVAFEFTVMGDTLNETLQLSEFGQRGDIWASKKVIENLSAEDRQRVEFGIRLGAFEDRFLSPGIYCQVRELLSTEEIQQRALQQISNLAVTEIINVQPSQELEW